MYDASPTNFLCLKLWLARFATIAVLAAHVLDTSG